MATIQGLAATEAALRRKAADELEITADNLEARMVIYQKSGLEDVAGILRLSLRRLRTSASQQPERAARLESGR